MSLPRQHQHANPYAPTITFPSPSSSHHPSDSRRGSSSSGGGATPFRLPRIFMRLFKFPQMDFELAVWEMTNLMMVPGGPKKVVRGLWYHVKFLFLPPPILRALQPAPADREALV